MAGGKRRRRRGGRRAPRGAAPGTLVLDPDAPRSQLHVFAYGPQACVEREIGAVDEVARMLGQHAVTWLNVDGLGDEPTLRRLGELFGVHRLALEDVVHVSQRPKIERYGDRLFIVVRMPTVAEDGTFHTEQLSLVLGPGFLVSFQERRGDGFDPVRQRLRAGKGRARAAGADYLAYALIDAVIDGYFPVLEAAGDRLDALEEEILLGGRPGAVGRIHVVRRDLLAIRRAIWPLREAISALVRDPDPLVADETRIHLRDCYDHVVQLIDLVENYRELGSGLTDVHLSLVSNRMNEIMKVLTIIGAVFIPLTFIAGVYGMNFAVMPELQAPWGYPAALVVMALSALGMVVFFRRKGWIGRPAELSGVEGPPRETPGEQGRP